MRYAVLVEVALRPGIADPQGATIERALPALGFDGISGVRAGKAFRFVVDADDEDSARSQVEPLQPFAGQPGDRILVGHPGAGPVTARVGVILFPGSNCEYDVVAALGGLGADATIVWHGDRSLGDVDAVVLPGGFAHGDYLRPGAIARFSPIMAAVSSFAAEGGPVVGICNGFQVLTEAHLLPGALQKNRGLTFLCTTVELEVTSDRSALTRGVPVGTRLHIPINHFEGNYTCDPATLARLQRGRAHRAPLRRQSQRVRSTTSPGSATKPATWSGSCPTPSGPATRSSAPPTGSCS